MPMRQCLALRSIWSCRTSQTTMANDYRALRLLSEHSGRDPSGLAEEDLRLYFVHVLNWAPKSCRQHLAAMKQALTSASAYPFFDASV